MKWTIEKVRELPEDNWLGIKRAGPHMWQIGGDIPGGMVMYTGDGGVVDYCTSVMETFQQAINSGIDKVMEKKNKWSGLD